MNEIMNIPNYVRRCKSMKDESEIDRELLIYKGDE